MRARVLYPVTIAVVAVWVITVLVSLYTHDYEAVQLVTPIMVILAGSVFGIELRRKNGDGENK